MKNFNYYSVFHDIKASDDSEENSDKVIRKNKSVNHSAEAESIVPVKKMSQEERVKADLLADRKVDEDKVNDVLNGSRVRERSYPTVKKEVPVSIPEGTIGPEGGFPMISESDDGEELESLFKSYDQPSFDEPEDVGGTGDDDEEEEDDDEEEVFYEPGDPSGEYDDDEVDDYAMGILASFRAEKDAEEAAKAQEEDDDEEYMNVDDSSGVSYRDYDPVVEDFKKNYGKNTDDDAQEVSVEDLIEQQSSHLLHSREIDSANRYYNDRSFSEEPVRSVAQQQSVRRQESVRRIYEDSSQVSVSPDDIKYSTIKKFPQSMAQQAKRLFPAATNMDDALTAYFYHHEGRPADMLVPDNIKQIADSYVGDEFSARDMYDGFLREISDLHKLVKGFGRKLDILELGVSYLMFDRIGFRRAPQETPGSINFLENGVTDLMKRLETQSDLNTAKTASRKNRTVR